LSEEPETLLQVDEALSKLLAGFPFMGKETVPVSRANGRVASRPVFANTHFPQYQTSSMDGFAVVASDTTGAGNDHPVCLKVVSEIPAGLYPLHKLLPGETSPIMTGAILPPGGDAVVPIEEVSGQPLTFNQKIPHQIQITTPIKPGNNVRQVGQDFQAGDELISANRPLRASEIALLSMLGRTTVQVYKRPQIAVLSTGNELATPGKPLIPGSIYDSNGPMLVACVKSAGGHPVLFGQIPDDRTAIIRALEQARHKKVDLIISSGGVSVGAYDLIREVIQEQGRLEFWKVNMRPGKPLAFGNFQGIPFIGLPGNPVSAFVGFEVFIRPTIGKMAGLTRTARKSINVVAGEEIKSDGRESYLRAIVVEDNGEMVARLTGHQGSGNLRSLVQANALLIIPTGVKSVRSGTELKAWLLD
jgi:molybdopterin molybdotransferase